MGEREEGRGVEKRRGGGGDMIWAGRKKGRVGKGRDGYNNGIEKENVGERKKSWGGGLNRLVWNTVWKRGMVG